MKRVTHSSEINNPSWLHLIFTGREGDAAGGDTGAGAGDGDGAGSDDGGDAGSGEGTDDGDKAGDSSDKEDNSGLKSALQKERSARKSLERELRKLQSAEEDRANADKSEVERAKAAEQKQTERVQALATRLRDTALENAITKAATAAKFRDPSDAMALISRSDITIDQDEDNPADIEIDEKSVARAVAALAAKKPHLVLADGDELPSGGKFNGSRKDSKQTDEEALKTKYPSIA